ncbi:DUF6883 domain-containing protein [Novosphingobium beihaiensis]|uniref:DUF6883 domain-containing protein n=1 Tax=Novosphingobium beihaiensis TaxID=2930389 RepID=A0ABT0BSC7_9SPHN|nr:DUF6883 domain-containing protein [Novosphingobium beihaiensis]MCJ2187883.1 hypothetical protein [Novosphingobium beihaiensis]
MKEPALSTFTSALLGAVSTADPSGTLIAELRGGLPSLSDFAAQISEVSSEPRRTSYTQSHDMDVYKLLLWDMSVALSEGAQTSDVQNILDVLRKRQEECLALSDIPESLREACDVILRTQPGYIGSYPIDLGNPILRRAFYDDLMHLALISDGSVIQQLSIEGEKDFELQGAKNFAPNGLKWINYSFISTPTAYQIGTAPLSERGALSVDRLQRKTHVTVEGRVFQALMEASWSDRSGVTYKFAAAEPGQDILQAVLPDGKFTGYLFNRDHEKGGAKARFIIDELGFAADDWRYLAAQFYDGLLLSEPRNLVVRQWNGGQGAQFNAFIKVTSRRGNSGILRTGWMLEPKKLPRLVTAVPDRTEDGLAVAPEPPVLPPMSKNADYWGALFELADEHGQKAYEATVPTPMLLKDFGIIEEGECGSAYILVADARRGFARWLINEGRGDRHHKGGAAISCQMASQSVERAEAYAKAFARVLALNGVPSSVEKYYT